MSLVLQCLLCLSPHPGVPGLQRRVQVHSHAPRLLHGVLSILDSCWPQGQPAPATAVFLSKAAGASSVLRLSEDQIQRKTGSNKLVQKVAT